MSLVDRLRRLEAASYEQGLWREARRLGTEIGVDPAVLVQEARQLARRIAELQATGLTYEGAYRAWAEEQGLDADELVHCLKTRSEGA